MAESFPDDSVGRGLLGVGAVSSVEPPFRPAYWERKRDKHWPLYSEPWAKVVRSTGEKEGVARYHPDLTHTDIERIEIACVSDPEPEEREIKSKRRPHVRFYWCRMNRIIGASDGEETEYIFVEYGRAGNVHGRPMTASQLRAKGAEL